MIWLLLFPAILLLLLCYLLFAPFSISLSSITGIIEARFHRAAHVQLLMRGDSLILDIRIVWWHKSINLFEPVGKQAVRIEKVGRKSSLTNRKTVSLRKMVTILESFKIKQCVISLCFDTMSLNGMLFPVFYWLKSSTGKSISINFWGENKVVLEIENTCFRILRAYLS
jgi:hypothetical protein